MIQQFEITLTKRPKGFHLITSELLEHIGKLPDTGLLNLFIKHTSAGLTINENADPSVRGDLNSSFDHIVKENEPYYTHIYEGSDDMPAHIKSSIVGSSVTVPITNGKLNLGVWQGLILCEFRRESSNRIVLVTIYS